MPARLECIEIGRGWRAAPRVRERAVQEPLELVCVAGAWRVYVPPPPAPEPEPAPAPDPEQARELDRRRAEILRRRDADQQRDSMTALLALAEQDRELMRSRQREAARDEEIRRLGDDLMRRAQNDAQRADALLRRRDSFSEIIRQADESASTILRAPFGGAFGGGMF